MNIAFCAYAYKENFQSGHNLQSDDTKNIYLKNSYVALRSCKYFNHDTEVALVTNIELSSYWRELFDKSKITVYKVEFDNFIFEEGYGWSLAFYKLCALKFICSLEYGNIVLLDTDTYTQRTFEDIWLGKVVIADDVVIGANTVVTKSILEAGITVAGIPAKKISDTGSEEYL